MFLVVSFVLQGDFKILNVRESIMCQNFKFSREGYKMHKVFIKLNCDLYLHSDFTGEPPEKKPKANGAADQQQAVTPTTAPVPDYSNYWPHYQVWLFYSLFREQGKCSGKAQGLETCLFHCIGLLVGTLFRIYTGIL